MVTTFVFQPTLLDCWACRDLKRFRQILKGAGGIVVTQASQIAVGVESDAKDGAIAVGGSVGGGGNNAGSPSTSQGRSPAAHTWGSAGNAFAAPCSPSEVNRRDHLGRTVLHLIASSTEPVSIDYLTAILSHPSVNVNLQDHENGWTALHRALYHGNLLTVVTLLKRTPPADVRVKDFEGLTPFDLYNSTVHGTNPPHLLPGSHSGELYTWGANRNFTLGIGTSDDRVMPDRVTIRQSNAEERLAHSVNSTEPGSKFDRIQVKDVGMSKFATVILTAESSSNVWVCGIGNTGRIGRAPQTQANFEPLRDFHETATAISVGPDHTCILTSAGDVYTFGFNRFFQLGYSLEHGQGIVSCSSKGSGAAATTTFGGATISNADLDVQISPRKVAGPLKKEHIVGIAAGKLHSAAFSSDALYTWGTNTGQLGYDRAATPTQAIPRKVTAITSNMSIESVAVTDFATACLLASGDVMLLHNDAAFFVRFPQLTFSSQVSVYRPRQARPKPSIHKIVAGPDNVFAAISDIGDLWQFAPDHPTEYGQSSGTSSAAKANIKPQLIWSVRKNKKVGAARDVGIGQGQDLILVTESGHVFIRSRKAESASLSQQPLGSLSLQQQLQTQHFASSSGQQSSVKGKSGWKPVPFLQRVIRVATNESGGWTAIKSEAVIREVRVRGRSLQEDLKDALPHLKASPTSSYDRETHDIVGDLADAVPALDVNEKDEVGEQNDVMSSDEEESETEDQGLHSIGMAQIIAEAARRWLTAPNDQQPLFGTDEASRGLSENEKLPLGCDMFVVVSSRNLPVHRCILSARLPGLAHLFCDPPSKGSGSALSNVIVRRKPGEYTTMTLSSCSFGTALFLLHYLYTDELPPIWTPSVGLRVDHLFSGLKMPASLIHSQLTQLAKTLSLSALSTMLASPIPSSPKARLSMDMLAFFQSNVDVPVDESNVHDVEVRFADDKVIPCHSVILRRSPFFATLLQPHWTSSRWSNDALVIDMTHTRWEVGRIVMIHLYTDKMDELLIGADAERTQDQFIDFVVEILAFSNELLLDKLKLACCDILRKRVIPTNVAAILTDADFYNASTFKEAVMDYASRTMETLLESGLLDDLEHRMIKDLTNYVRRKQDERLHRTRANEYVSELVTKHNDYYFDLDIPPPSLGIAAARVPKRLPRLSESRASPAFEAVHEAGRLSLTHLRSSSSPAPSPHQRPLSRAHGTFSSDATNDDSMLFSMDDDDVDVDEAARSKGERGAHNSFALPPPALTTTGTPPVTPWKSKTAEAQRKKEVDASPLSTKHTTPQDLRSIMAAEQFSSSARQSSSHSGPRIAQVPSGSSLSALQAGAATTSSEQTGWSTIGGLTKMSQRDRKRQQQQHTQQQQQLQNDLSTITPASPPSNVASASTNVSPWRQIGVATPSRPPMQTVKTISTAASLPYGKANAGASPADTRTPSFGPTYAPTRSRPVAPRRGLSGASSNDVGGAVSGTTVGIGGGLSSVWSTSSTPHNALSTSPSNRTESVRNGPVWGNGHSPLTGSPAIGPMTMTTTHVRPHVTPRISSGLTNATVSSAATGNVRSTIDASQSGSQNGGGGGGGHDGSVAGPSQPPKSFAEIQNEELRQLEAMQAMQMRAPKSFAELQEEDRRDNERRVKEERERREFEEWFEEEQRRVKKEQQQRQRKESAKRANQRESKGRESKGNAAERTNAVGGGGGGGGMSNNASTSSSGGGGGRRSGAKRKPKAESSEGKAELQNGQQQQQHVSSRGGGGGGGGGGRAGGGASSHNETSSKSTT